MNDATQAQNIKREECHKKGEEEEEEGKKRGKESLELQHLLNVK